MTLDELNKIDITNPEQVKKAQEFLKSRGHYTGRIDGEWGKATAASRKAFGKAEQEKQADEAAREEREFERGQRAADAEAERERKRREEEAERKRREQEAQRERDVETSKVQAGSAAGGLASGLIGAKIADAVATPVHQGEMKARGEQLGNLAKSSRAIDPTASNARQLHGDISKAAQAGSLTKKPLPWGTTGLAASLAGLGGYSTFERAPESKSDLERAIWTGTGYGEMSASAKMLADSLRRYKNPGVAYPADDVAAIQSSQRIAGGGPITPVAPSSGAAPYAPPQRPSPIAETLAGPQSAPAQTASPMPHSQRLASAVAATGGSPGKSKSANYSALARNLTQDNTAAAAQALNLPADAPRRTVLQRAREMMNSRGISSVALPVAAGAMAYDAVTSPAEASAEGVTTADRAKGAAAAGTAAGTTYGTGKLAQALAGSRAAPFLGPAMNVAGAGLAAHDYAGQVQDMRQNMPEGMTSDLLAQAAPLAMRGMEDAAAWQNLPGQARDFVQRNQSDPSMGMTDEVQAMPPQAPPGAPPPQDPMMQANALQIPHDQIQQSQTDMAFDPAMREQPQGMELPPEIQQQMQMLVQQGAPPDLIASYLNHIAAQ